MNGLKRTTYSRWYFFRAKMHVYFVHNARDIFLGGNLTYFYWIYILFSLYTIIYFFHAE